MALPVGFGGVSTARWREQVSTATTMVLESIGQKLKLAREGQGLSLSDIYQRTKIPVTHLQSIDNGAAEDLPEPVYVSGFIRRYAECVGLNPQSLVEEYRQQTEGNGNGRSKNKGAVLDRPLQPVMMAPPHVRTVKMEQGGGPGILRTMGVSVFWIIVILGLITFLFWWNSNNQTPQDSSQVLSMRDLPNRLNSVSPSGAPPSATDKTLPAAPGDTEPTDSRISLSASQHVWVEVKSIGSGDSLFTGYLEAGDRRDFQDPQGLRVRAGNGGSLSVEQNGKSNTFGLPGKITEKTFMAKTAAGTTPDAGATSAATSGTAAVKPIVKKVTRRPTGDGTTSAPRRRIAPVGGDRYIPGESLRRGGSSYTDGRLDTD